MNRIKHLALLLLTALVAVACSKEEKEKVNPAQEAAGVYKGYTTAQFQYSPTPMTTAGETVTLTANADGTMTIDYTSAKWGKFAFKSANVTASGKEYKITGDGTTLMGMTEESKKEYPCTVEGTVPASKQGVSFIFNIPGVMGGVKITFTQGDMPATLIAAGTYSGNLKLMVAGTEQGTVEGSKMTVTAGENNVSVKLAGFGFGPMQLEDINIDNVNVAADGDNVKLSGDISTQSGTIKVTGKLEGTVKADGSAEVTFTIRPGAMPMDVTAIFTGSK